MYPVDPSKPCTQNYLQKIAICINLQLPIVILEKKSIISDMRHRKGTCISIFIKIGLVDQLKPCAQIYLIFFKLHKFATCNLNRILKNHAFRTCTTPSRTFRPILRSIGLLDIKIPRKEILSTDDRLTDGRTDVAYDNNKYFFSKKNKKILKMICE